MTGRYDVLTIYDRKDYYRVKDLEQKKLIQQLENDPDIEKIGPGRYRCKSGKLRSFASINQNRRWRMEIVEMYDGKKVVYRDRYGDEKEQRPCFTPIDNRTWKTYFKDVARAYWGKLTLYFILYSFAIIGCIVIGDDLLNPSRGDPFQKNSGPIELLFSICGLIIMFPWMYFFFGWILIPINVLGSYRNQRPILIPMDDI